MRRLTICLVVSILCGAVPRTAAAQDEIYFPAVHDVTSVLVQRIHAENVRIDMAAWYLTERAISIALVNRHKAGVQVRLLGDRGSIFEIDQRTRAEFYWLASQGIPIRLRYHPATYPEILHWKATIFAGQNLVTFGSANYTPFELAPSSSTNYKDEVVLFSADPQLVNPFRTQFDRIWNDTTYDPRSRAGGPPYLRDWNSACAVEPQCSDYAALYPQPAPMLINTARLEPDYPMPPELVWGQGAVFNARLIHEIQQEPTFIDLVTYRLTVPEIADALIAKRAGGMPVRVIMEPEEYRNRKWPEFWLTRAQIDRLWAAGVSIKQRAHTGLTHMKTLITSSTATIASSNFTAAWQRDHNYFLPAATKPRIHAALRHRFNVMWDDPAAFTNFVPEPADAPVLQSPPSGQSGVSNAPVLTWERAAFATRYDVYLGASPAAMNHVGTVHALLVNDPPLSYTWTPPPLAASTTYYWRVVSRTNANLSTPSSTHMFTTGPAAATTVSPRNVYVGPENIAGAVSVNAPAGYAWNATSNAGWVTVSPASGSGSGSVTFSIGRNSTAASRMALVSIGDARVTVIQGPNDMPPPPTALQVAVSGTSVRFTWQRAPTSDATRYLIEVSPRPDLGAAVLFETAAASYDLHGVPAGRFWVRVSAANSFGAGLPTSPVAFDIGGPQAPVPPGAPPPGAPPPGAPPPGAPHGLTWALQGSRLTLAWTPGNGGSPDQYVIEAGAGPSRADLRLPSGSPTPSYVYDGVPPGVYYVRVRAVNSAGFSPPSNEVTVYVGVVPPPAAPTHLHASVAGSHVTLTWRPGVQNGAGAPSYYVLAAGSGPTLSNLGTYAVGATSVVVPGVPPGRYWVRVYAVNGSGPSGPSAEIMVSVP